MSVRRDWWEVLGVAANADEKTVRRAYRRLAFEWHPDRAAARGLAEALASEMRMREINAAFDEATDDLRARAAGRGPRWYEETVVIRPQRQAAPPVEESPFAREKRRAAERREAMRSEAVVRLTREEVRDPSEEELSVLS